MLVVGHGLGLFGDERTLKLISFVYFFFVLNNCGVSTGLLCLPVSGFIYVPECPLTNKLT